MVATSPRLLAVSPTGQQSGAEAVLLRTLRAMRQRGWDVGCASPSGSLIERLAANDVPHVPLPELKLTVGDRRRSKSRALRAIGSAAHALHCQSRGQDLILANGLQALLPLRLAGPHAPVAWLVHDVIQRPDRLRYLAFAQGTVDLAIAVSEAAAMPLRTRRIPTRIVRNGTPWPVEPASPSPEPRIIGCNGLLTSWKGQQVLLDAFTRLSSNGPVLLEFVGATLPTDAEYAERLRATALAHAPQRVIFRGGVDDPLSVMRRWTVAVSASVEPEAAPLNVLEAMSLGLPVIGTDHGGTPEVLSGIGVLVPPADAGALSAAISKLLDDHEGRARMGWSGRARVANSLSTHRQEGALCDLLESLANR